MRESKSSSHMSSPPLLTVYQKFCSTSWRLDKDYKEAKCGKGKMGIKKKVGKQNMYERKRKKGKKEEGR